MPRSFSRLRPVRSIKHVVDTNGGITGATPSTTDVILASDTPSLSSVNLIETAATVHAIFLNVQVIQVVAAGGVDNIYMIVYKNPAGNLVAPAVDLVGGSDRKRFVIHQEMLMTGNVNTGSASIPRTLFKGVINIPSRLKRFGYQDELQVIIGHRTGEATQVSNFCLQCIYKEFR